MLKFMVDSFKLIRIPQFGKQSPEKENKRFEDEAFTKDPQKKNSNDNKIRVSYNDKIFFNPSEQNDTIPITNKKSVELSKSPSNMSYTNITSNEESYKRLDSPNFKYNVERNNNSTYSNVDTSNGSTRFQKGDNIRNFGNSDQMAMHYIPCMNCGNDIHMDEIDQHAMSCIKMVEEMNRAEESSDTNTIIDYRLKKLLDHVTFLKESSECNATDSSPMASQGMSYITTVLYKDIFETLAVEAINQKSIFALKKHLTNLNMLSHTSKGSMPALIIIDRARVLVNEKLKIFKHDYLLQKQITKAAKERKSGSYLLEEKLRKKTQNLIKLEQERELERIKVNSLRNTRSRAQSEHVSEPGIEEGTGGKDQLGNNFLDPNRITCKLNIVRDIESDIDTKSVKSGVSLGTSMTSNSIIKEQMGDHNVNNTVRPYSNELKDFVKMVLKVKFEILHNSHKGQQISARDIYDEMTKANIPRNKWQEFIIRELNQVNKYAINGNKNSKKNQSGFKKYLM